MIAAEVLPARPVAASPASPLARGAGWLAPAAAGVLLGASIFDLIPSAFATIGNQTIGWAAAGLSTMIFATALASNANRRWVGWAAGIGIWLHSLLEGFTAGTGYGFGAYAGVLISIRPGGASDPGKLGLVRPVVKLRTAHPQGINRLRSSLGACPCRTFRGRGCPGGCSVRLGGRNHGIWRRRVYRYSRIELGTTLRLPRPQPARRRTGHCLGSR